MNGSLESLEPRVVLSVFYDISVIAAVGDRTTTGETIDSIDGFASINDNGRVAFTANVSDALGAGSALVVDDGTGAPVVLNILNADQSFAFPQINNAGLVTARDRFGTTVDSFVRTWNSNSPGQFTTVAGSNPAAGDVYDSVTLPTLADDGAIGFIGFTNGSAQTDLYYNPSGTRFDEQSVLTVTGTGGLRPMISNNGMLVVKRGSGASADIVVASTSGTFSVASSATGFTSLGSAPSISDNGRLVAFAGDRGNGPGIFLAVLNASGTGLVSLERIAGETAAPGNHNELGYDAAGNPLFLNAFDIESRVGISRKALGTGALAGDSVVLTFVATPNAASRSNPQAGGRPLLFSDQSGLWTVQVDFQVELAGAILQPHVKSPIPVVQLGDSIAGQPVTGITLYDPIAVAATDTIGNARTPRMGEHRLAFVANTATTSMVVRASQLDSDEDGLYDHWERAGGGIDMDQDGTIDLDLSAMGASVLARDLFLEVDWLNPRINGGALPWRNEPAPGALQSVVMMFAAAPALANGIPAGITLHIDAGSGNDALGNAFSFNMGVGSLQGGDQIGQAGTGAHLDVVHFGLPGSVAIPGVQARAFSNIKDNFFGTTDKRARELAFRYSVLADFHSSLTAAGAPVGGSVAAATAMTITSTAPLPAANYPGHVVMITAGTGAGQIRGILGQPSPTTLNVSAWAVVPDATSQFVILSGSSGRGEVAWFPAPDNYSVPGNDFLITLGNFGVSAGILGNSFTQSRTLAHEMGHTLGLRHGGIDHQAFKGANYLSLMSYSHQLTVASAVNSYSIAGDPTFDDWANLKLGFQNTLIHVGNTFGRGLGNSAQVEDEPELTVAQVEEINGGPLDLEAPDVSIHSPAANTHVQLNDAFAVVVQSADLSGVETVEVRFDVNGGGDIDDTGETVIAAPSASDTYTAALDNLSGPTGPRMLRVIAIDTLGNLRIDDRNLEVVADDDPNGPEIRVTGNGVPIVDGSLNPTAADHTSFDSVVRDQPKPRRTFTVHNSGAAALALGAVAVPAGFTLVEPLASTVGIGQSDSFTVELDTSTVGVFTGEVSFTTNDLNENPFTFVISAIVAAPAPEIEIIGNGQVIVDGDTSPSSLNHTDFGLSGQFQVGTTRIFTVRNTGSADLTLGPITVPLGFAVVEPLAASLAPGASDTFSVQLETSALGTFRDQLSFSTNDADEHPFNFVIAGAVGIIPGSLDLTFGGGDGKVMTNSSFDRAQSVVLQPDGKILIGGSNDSSNGFMLARYNADGTPDATFGGGDGVVLEGFPGNAFEEGEKVLLLADGKILLAGTANTVAGTGIGLMRINADGSLDTTFDGDGKMTRVLALLLIADAALQADGKVVVVGFSAVNGNDFAVARFNPNGTLDTTFGGDGLVTTDFGSGGNDPARAVEIDAGGRIVVAGVANGGDFGLARYNADGTLDTTFGGGDGLVITDFAGGGADAANGLVLQPDGKIVLVGQGGTTLMAAVARYNTDGSLDSAFAGDGTALATVGAHEIANAVAIQPDGKIVIAGDAQPAPDPRDHDFFVARFHSDGTLDHGFNSTGFAMVDFAGLNDFGTSIAIQPDKRIVVAGSGFPNSSGLDFAVARLYGDLVALPTVSLTATDAEASETGEDGLRYTVTRTGIGDEPLTVQLEVQNDGVAGQATLGSDYQLSVAPLQVTIPAGMSSVDITATIVLDDAVESDELVTLAILASTGYVIGAAHSADGIIHGECEHVMLDGRLDPTFGGGDGHVATDFGVGALFSSSVAVQPDHKILVASRLSGQEKVALARYRMNGIPDPAFDNDGLLITPLDVIGDMRPTVAVQPDGKIVAAGVFSGQNINFGMVRYHSNGTIDATFGGGDGIVETDFVGSAGDILTGILIQPDGKILLVGQSIVPFAGADFALAQYNPDGTLDTTFGVDGRVTTDFGFVDKVLHVALQPDGKILAVGSTNPNDANNSDFALARYNADGSLDTTFGTGGRVITSIHHWDEAVSVAIADDGKVLVAGHAFIVDTQTVGGATLDTFAVVAQYTADGTLDGSFGDGDGLVLERFQTVHPSQSNLALNVLVQPDGKIIVVGSDEGGLAVARYDTNGTRDATFGSDGLASIDQNAQVGPRGFNVFYGAALQPDGMLLITTAGNLNLTRLSGECVVSEGNQAPSLEPIDNRVAEVGQIATFTAAATDPDGDTLTFTLDVGAPAGATINAQTGEFSFAPSAAQAGLTFEITVRVTDDGQPALSDTDTFTISVASEGNEPPALDPIADVIGEVGQIVSFIAAATDPDGDTLTFTLEAGAPTGATINAQTGEFSFAPTAGQAGQVFSITVRVTDDRSPALADTESFNVTVQPQFTLSPIIGPDVGVPGQLRSYSVTFTDPNSIGNYTTTINWGDGVVDSGVMSTQTSGGVTTGVVSFWHTYTSIGDRNIRLLLQDRLGNQLTAQKFVTVQLVTFQPDPLNASRRALVAGGLEGVNDLITFNPQSGGINVMYRDYNHGRFLFDGSAIAFGQSGNDTIRVHPSITNTSMLFGQAGDDLLVAGAGASVLVGGAGNDTLHGSALRDLLFGGLGADLLHGIAPDRAGAMDEGDLIASDVTAWEYDPNLLASTFDRWTSANSYADRLTNLRYLQSPALNNTTVFDDLAADRLTGGTGLDWFVFFSTDLSADPENGEEGLGVRL